jgi:hypothetical protein
MVDEQIRRPTVARATCKRESKVKLSKLNYTGICTLRLSEVEVVNGGAGCVPKQTRYTNSDDPRYKGGRSGYSSETAEVA